MGWRSARLGEYKACQQCIGEYYLDLKTFSSSRSCTEISVLTQMCRKGQCLQQIATNELGHTVHRFFFPSVFWLMSQFTSMTLREETATIFFHDQTRMSSRHFKERKESFGWKTEVCRATPRRIMALEALFVEFECYYNIKECMLKLQMYIFPFTLTLQQILFQLYQCF